MKRYVEEAGTATVRRLLTGSAVATSRLSEVEVASALARRCREGTLSLPERDRTLGALAIDIASLYVVEIGPEVARASVALLSRHALRTGDAIQLASCLFLRLETGDQIQLVAADTRLSEAARAEGVPVLLAT